MSLSAPEPATGPAITPAPWKSTVGLLVAIGATALINLTYNVLCARWLGAADYADFAAALALVAVTGYALNPLGLVTAQLASRFAARGEIGKVAALHRSMQRRLAIGSAIGLIAAVPLILFGARLFRFGSQLVLVITFAIVAVVLFLAVSRAVVRALQQFHSYARGLVGESTFRLALGVSFLWLAPTASAALFAYLIASTAILLAHETSFRKRWRGVEQQETATADFSVIAPGWALLIAYGAAQNLDLLMIKAFADRADAGVYAAAATVVRSLMMVLAMPVDALLLPRMGASVQNPRRAAHSVGRLFVALWAAPMLLLLLFPSAVMTRVFGASFADAATLLPWLTIGGFALSCSYLAGQALLFLRSRFFLVFMFTGLAVEAAVIAFTGGDFPTTVRTVAGVQVSIAAITALFWIVASRSSAAHARS